MTKDIVKSIIGDYKKELSDLRRLASDDDIIYVDYVEELLNKNIDELFNILSSDIDPVDHDRSLLILTIILDKCSDTDLISADKRPNGDISPFKIKMLKYTEETYEIRSICKEFKKMYEDQFYKGPNIQY